MRTCIICISISYEPIFESGDMILYCICVTNILLSFRQLHGFYKWYHEKGGVYKKNSMQTIVPSKSCTKIDSWILLENSVKVHSAWVTLLKNMHKKLFFESFTLSPSGFLHLSYDIQFVYVSINQNL